MSAISLKSITGITSITTPAGVDNQLTLHTNDTTQRVKVTQSGIEVVGVATFQDIDVDGHTNLDNVSIAGVSTFSDNVSFTTANGNGIIISKSSNYMAFGNSVTQYFGGTSMWLQHNGSTGYLHNVTGGLYIRNEDSSGGNIYIQGKSGEHSIVCNYDSDVQLYYDGGIVAQTTQYGFQITNGALDLNNTGGSGASIRCQSVGTFYVGAAAQGDLVLYCQDNTNNSVILQANTGEKYVECNMGGSVDLWYHGGLVAKTTQRGLRLISNLASSGGVSNMLQLDNTGNNTGDGSKITFSRAGTIRTEIEALKNETANNETDIVFRTTLSGSLGEKLRITSGGKVNIGGDYTSTTSTLRVIGDSNAGSQTYLEKNSGSTNNTYNSVLTLSSRSTGSAAANYGPAIGFQHAFGASNYAGCLIASQCNADVNTADLVFYPRNYGYTERLRIASNGQTTFNTNTLTVSSGTSGDCVLIIEADTDNNNEDDNPRIEFKQDGGLPISSIGHGLLSGDQNGLVLANSVTAGYMAFATGNSSNDHTQATERLRITGSGEVNIGGNYTQTSAPLTVTTSANDYGIRLLTGSNVVIVDILNNDSAGNCEIRGYYNNNSGTRGEGFRIESNGNTFFSPAGSNRTVSITNAEFQVNDNELQITSSASYATHLNYQDNGSHYISMANTGATQFRRSQSGGTVLNVYGNGNIGAPSGNNIYNASDERLKENMVELTDGLDKIKKLKPYSFTWKKGFDKDLEGITQYGFGAHQAKTVDEKLVEKFALCDVDVDGETIEDPLRVNEKHVIPLLVKAIQEQQEQIETLKAKVSALEGS